MSRLPCLLLGAAVLLAGCGGEERADPSAGPVRLALESPRDGFAVSGDRVEVRGRVRPASAEVLVGGEAVDVEDGAFATTVSLEEGNNVVDVVAGAPGRPAAMTAVRVVREARVAVPDVIGRPPEAAVEILEDAGLRTTVVRGGGLLDDLLPGTDGVCSTDPAPGDRVRPGTEVVVEIAKPC